MRILLVSGIYPPDIGGPATHAAALRAELLDRGHEVTVLTLSDSPPSSAGPGSARSETGVVRFPRSLPWPVRNAQALAWVLRNRQHFDVVYATGLGPLAVSAARLARLPVVLKTVGDPAWERAVRRGLTDASFEQFQRAEGGTAAVRGMRLLRNWTARRATVLVTPSAHLAQAVSEWTGRTDVVVVPNGAVAPEHVVSDAPDDDHPLRLLFVGRLIGIKRVELIIEAVASTEAAELDVIGDGPESATLRTRARDLGVAERVHFLGSLDHSAVMRHIASADALVLASTHEGLPHVVIEALVSGTPVLTTAVGGVPELVEDGRNGLIVDASVPAFASAFDRMARDPELVASLRRGALESGETWRFDHCVDRLESLMRSTIVERPLAVYVGKSRATIPPRPDDERKYEINERYVHTFVVCTAERFVRQHPGGATVIGLPFGNVPAVGSVLFYALAPAFAVAVAATSRDSAVVCQSPYEGFGVVVLRGILPRRIRPMVQIELHGDWKTATRLYGGNVRRLLSGAADHVAEWSLRRADRVRPVSEVLAGRAREAGYRGPLDRFVAFSDYSSFLDRPVAPLPTRPHALFVGVFERYKGIDVLFEAWPAVAEALPDAHLTLIGAGSQSSAWRERAQSEAAFRDVEIFAPVPRSALIERLDDATCLVLPSRSEGLARIVLEAMARARPIVASRVGGIEEVVSDRVNGRIVESEDVEGLAKALVDMLGDRDEATRMGEESRRRVRARDPLREYEAGMARMAGWITQSGNSEAG